MNKAIYLVVLMCALLSPALVSAVGTSNVTQEVIVSGASDLHLTLVNQDPATADPGGYVTLLFKVENRGTDAAQAVKIELVPQYPFSLDPGVSAVSDIGVVNGQQTGTYAYLLRYKLKVDKDALDGSSEIKLKYSESGSNYYMATFSVVVSNPRTDFDVVLQESATTTTTGTAAPTVASTTIAIANIGDNTASSVIVSIPAQKNFRAVGVYSSIVGNLNAGDYTPVTFQVAPTSNASSRESNLTVEIAYTDTLGIRRTVDKDVMLSVGGAGFAAAKTTTKTQAATTSSGITYVIIGVVGIAAIVVLLKWRTMKKKTK